MENMNLPDLPRTIKKKEASFGLTFRKWIKENWKESGVFELKQCDTSFNFSDLKEHQVIALRQVKGMGLIYKIADDSRGVKPFDYMFLKDVSAFVVIHYGSGHWYAIDVDAFLLAACTVGRKSLTENDARAYCSFHD
jgi:hypothetical protein